MNRIFLKLFVYIAGTVTLLLTVGCIDTVKKNPVVPGSKIVCRIDANRCLSCGLCSEACPQNAILEKKLDGIVVYIIDPQKCNGCGACIQVCEDNAIKKVSYHDGEER